MKGYNLFHNLGRTVQINQSFMNPHLKSVPSLRSFTTWRLPCRDPQTFGGQAYRTFYLKLLLLSTFDQITANFRRQKICGFPISSCKNLGRVGWF